MNKKERKIKFLEIHLKIYRMAVVVFIGATKKEIEQEMQGHILEKCELIGKYQRGKQ